MSESTENKVIKLNLGRLADARSEYPLLASNVYFAAIREVELKPSKTGPAVFFNWKLQVLNEDLLDTEGQPIKAAKFFLFHSYSATPKPDSDYNPDNFTLPIIKAVSQEAVDKWYQTGDITNEDVLGAVIKITVGLEGPREYFDKATKEKKTSPARNKIDKFIRLTDEEAAAIQVPNA